MRIDQLLNAELRSVSAAFDEDPVGLEQFAAPWVLECRAERNAMIAALCQQASQLGYARSIDV